MKNKEFEEIIQEFINNETVLSMKEYIQHSDVNCFEHCYDVAYNCYKVAKKLKLDYVSVTRAAMLHDMFLYDWHKEENRHQGHAFKHAKKACENASKIFKLSDKEKDMIEKHMWPLTLRIPKSKEGILLTFIDKYCTIKEEVDFIYRYLTRKKALRYSMFLLQMLLIRL